MASRLLPLLVALAVAGCGGNAADETLHSPPGADATHATRASDAGVSSSWMPDGPRAEAVLWAVGDGPGGRAGEKVASFIAGKRPDRVLYLGDVYERGSAAEFRSGYAGAWGDLARITAPTPGNHEWPKRSEGYRPFWATARGSTPPDWYAFSTGGWRILALNSETSRRREQLRWLRSQLRARGDCRLAFWHRPRFSAGPHGDSTSMDPFWRALRGKARLVVSGHDHNMQRFRARGGLVQLVSGAGGRGHYRVKRSRAGLAFGDTRHYGALRIELRTGSARIAFVSTSGRTLDATRVRCDP